MKYIENEAHKHYEENGNVKFNDIVVFNEVIFKILKWTLLKDHGTTRYEEDNKESKSVTKRSRTTKEGNYSKPDTQNSGSTTMQRLTCRYVDKRKVKI